jgi:hypothetical protein
LHRAEGGKIAQWQARIGQLNAEVPGLNQTKQRAEVSLPGYLDSVKICALSSDSLKNAEHAVRLTIETFSHIIIFDRVLQKRLLKIFESGQSGGDWSLSVEIKKHADKYRLTQEQRLQLLAIATALDILAEKDQAWKVEEQIWLESVKKNIASAQNLVLRLQPLYDQIVFDIKNKEESCKRSAEQVATFNEQVANSVKRLGEISTEITGLNANIAQSNQTLNANPRCPPEGFNRRREVL